MRNKPEARKLRQNETTRVPSLFCFVDTETLLEEKDDNKTIHHFRLGVAIFVRLRKGNKLKSRTVLRFTDINDFWNEVDKRIKGKNTIHIIAHNALFDLTVLKFQTKLTQLNFDCDFIFDQGLTFISKWSNGERRIMMLDNTNWHPGKLEMWGKALGFDKMSMPDFKSNDKIWFEYCERDTEIMERLQDELISFIIDNDLGNWKFTLASLSFNTYRHRFMIHPIYIPNKSRETFLARNSYKGGRTECFYFGKPNNPPFYKLDINSMYPYVMALGMFPTSVEGYASNPTLAQIDKTLTKYSICGKFRVRLNVPWIPHKINNKTCYPLGTFDTYLCSPEIKVLLNEDMIVSCDEVAIYRQRDIFSQFVHYFYSQKMLAREDNHELKVLQFKLVLNTLYGKFGQRKFKDEIIGQAELNSYATSYFIDGVTKEKGIIRQIGYNVIKSTKSGEGYNSFVAIASHVTSYARVLLYSLILKAGRNNVFYCDTDSIICNQAGYDRLKYLVNNDKIGSLKVEAVSDVLEIIAPKHYTFGKEIKIKGISKSAKQTGEFTYEQEIWPGLNSINDNNPDTYYNYTICKTLNARVSSGSITSSGYVLPYAVKDEMIIR